MSSPVNLRDLPAGVLEEVFPPTSARGRMMGNSLTPLSFPRTRLALWDSRPSGEMLRLQLCSHRKPRLLLLEKALCLAQRHTRRCNKTHLHCFFLGSVSVDADEEGLTVVLDRFDPGHDHTGASCRVPSTLLPGDTLVPCLFSTKAETSPDTLVQSEADLQHCFKVLQQYVTSQQPLDLSQLLKVKVRVSCQQQNDSAAFGLSWSAVCPSISLDIQQVRPIPIIPTALLRILTSVTQQLPLHTSSRQRGFLTMDQTRKLLLLLESDPKASSLPLVGLWLSGVTHINNPQVWAWCLRFLFGSALQDRVLSESGFFLLVIFSSTHKAPQFFQCRRSRPGTPQLEFQLLGASQCLTLYQVAGADNRTLQCELTSEHHKRQMQVFSDAQRSFSSSAAAPQPAGLAVSDQDSGVEDEDLSPRPSPSPHLPAQQTCRVQPSVPELSLLIDGSFTSSNQNAPQDAGSTRRPPSLPNSADRKSVAPAEGSSFSPQAPLHLHSTPNSNLQQPCTCCHTHHCTSILSSVPHPAAPPTHPLSAAPPSAQPSLPCVHPSCVGGTPPSSSPVSHCPSSPPSAPLPSTCCPCSRLAPVPWFGDSFSPHAVSPPCLPHPPSVTQQPVGVITSDAYQLLLQQDQQLRLLQVQVQTLLEAQGKLQASNQPAHTQTTRSTASVAVGTGASLFWEDSVKPLSHQEVQLLHLSSPQPSPSLPSCDLSINTTVGGDKDSDNAGIEAPCSPSSQQSVGAGPSRSPILVLGESASMLSPSDVQQSFYHSLMTQLTSRLQESDSREKVEVSTRRRSLTVAPDSSTWSSSNKQQRCGRDQVVSATLRQLQQLGVDVDRDDITEHDRRINKTVESSSTLACINPAAVLSRLSVSEPGASMLFPGGSVDLSLEANAIALRYLSDSQLCRLSLGGRTPPPDPASLSTASLLSPSNMSLATRKYMKRYGLIEEEEEGQDDVQEVLTRQPLIETVNLKLLPQSQLIRDLQPKMQLLVNGAKSNIDQENCPSTQPSLVRASSRQMEGSVGNILDLSRLRQLPKLF
ncbi:SCL-interrupting locus protein homolog [Aulostomus maculatus]